ncbi:MAG TPA: hypothetical protein VMB02_01440 [Candidatus Aquilonibacter sp.]|nr:hypothetical protein [Candidatus Aquilonibacter sp.]
MIRMLHKLALAAAVLALVLAFASFANARPAPERHSDYLHALEELRYARALIQNPDSGQIHDAERQAMQEIDGAIRELKAASIDDGKDINDHPGIDSHLRWIPRLNKAAQVLNKAHDDAAKEEDDPASQGLQGRILEHIGQAHKHVEEAIALEQ